MLPEPKSPGAWTAEDVAAVEALTRTLVVSSDVTSALPAALAQVLASVRRSGGAFLVQPAEAGQPPLIVTHRPPEAWAGQLHQPGSVLRQLAHAALQMNELPPPQPALGLGAVVPVMSPVACVGLLLVAGEPCTPEETHRLAYLCRFVGQAIQLSLWYNAARDRGQELAALHKISATLTSTLQLDEILTSTVDGIRQILNVEAASLLLLDEEHGELLFKKTLSEDPDWTFQYSAQVGQGLAGDCVRTGEPIIVNAIESDPRFSHTVDAVGGFQTRNLLCAPLIAHGQKLGAIEVLNKRNGPFNLHDQELLISMAASVANAIYNARLFHKLTVANADLEASRWEVMRSRSTLLALFDGIPNPIYIVDRDYKLIAVNKTCARSARPAPDHPPRGARYEALVRPMPQELVGRLCYRAIYGRSQPCPGCRITETLATGNSTHRSERREEPDDQTSEWEISTYPITNERAETVQVIVFGEDVTEKRRLEASLFQSEKLAAIGQLAAGVAHEINNPLAAIIANSQLLQRDLPRDSEAYEAVDLIARAGDRAMRVVRSLLDFARQEHYEFALIDLNESIEQALALIQHQLRSVTLVRDLAPDLPPVPASQDHLQGVWLNLLLNARDAINGAGGEVRIITRQADEALEVIIADNGSGISPEKLSRIFEPFYTTKGPGRGTGLGLAVCHRIIKQHGGHIHVESHLKQGTKFTVTLPLKPPASAGEGASS
jgi:two-component system NtrC family sensor kinase